MPLFFVDQTEVPLLGKEKLNNRRSIEESSVHLMKLDPGFRIKIADD
jgi:hypothetical protein